MRPGQNKSGNKGHEETTTTRKGWLEKLGGSSLNKWQRRYFVLSDGVLSWSEHPNEPAKNSLIISGVMVQRSTAGKYGISLSAKKDTYTYNLSASNAVEQREWIDDLNAASAAVSGVLV